MRMFIWGPAVVIPLVAVVFSMVVFLGIAFIMDAIYPASLTFGTILFIVISAGAWLLARRTEPADSGHQGDESTDHA